MPKEIKSREEFDKILPMALEIRVVRSRGSSKGKKDEKDEESKEDEVEEGDLTAKVKIRTNRQLYTYKTTESEVDSLVKGTKAEVLEY